MPVYERFRGLARVAPLLRARGRLERREGTTNVLVSEVMALERSDVRLADVRRIDPAARRREREQVVAEL